MVLKHYIWLTICAVFALWQSTQIQYWSPSFQTLLLSMPYIVVAVGVFISLWLNRIQPLLILLTIGALNVVLAYFAPTMDANLTGSVVYPALTILLPVSLLLWILLPEKGLYNKRFDIFVMLLFAAQALLIYWLVTELPFHWVEKLSIPVMKERPEWVVPFAGSLTFLLAGFVLSVRLLSLPFKVLYHAFIVVMLLLFYGLNSVYEPGVLAWISTVAAILIVISVVFDSHHIAYTDELTGLYGRRALMEAFLGLGKKYVLVMIDIDHFKKFNDTYGHDIGDEVLCTVANVLNTVKGGRAFRYGGEEFSLLFSNKNIAQVLPEVERLRAAIEKENLSFTQDGKKVSAKVTISAGVAASAKSFKAPNDVLKHADNGLYAAKKAGRNCVVEMDEKGPVKPAAKSEKKTKK